MRTIAATPEMIGTIVVLRALIANPKEMIMIGMSVVAPSQGAKH